MSSSRTETLVDVTMPQMGVSVAEGTVVRWLRSPGDKVLADETICEITTDKIDAEVPAPATGTVVQILVAEEETVAVGSVLARIATGASGDDVASAPAPAAAPAAPAAAPAAPAATPNGAPRPPAGPISPVVRRIAAEHGIDLAAITGTGRDGRIRKQDVLAAIGTSTEPAAEEPPLHIDSPYRPDPPRRGADGATSERLPRVRRQIGEHMVRSLQTAAHCTTWIEADMARIEAARAADGLTALPYVAAATVATLREFPMLNAWLEGETFTRHRAVNLGIAVSLGEDGLIVPVVHHAEELSVAGLAARIRDLATRARAGRLSADEVNGGTFTITNPGQFGSIMATPIINQPQVAILDLEAVVKRPVVLSGAGGVDAIAIRPITILGLSWDHRALDGALAARFLAALRDRLEEWPAG